MFVYVIGPAKGPFKIGIASDLKRRLAGLQTGHFERLEIHACRNVESTTEARTIEKQAHIALSAFRISGEWFRCDLEQAAAACGARPLEITIKHKENRWQECYDELLAHLRQSPEKTWLKLGELHGISPPTPEAICAHCADRFWPRP